MSGRIGFISHAEEAVHTVCTGLMYVYIYMSLHYICRDNCYSHLSVQGELNDELAMKPGDVITVNDWTASKDWARGTLNGKTGLFYKHFVKPSSEVPSPNDCKLKKVRGKPKGHEACYQGREYVLKEKLDEVECIICHELADNAHQTSCCGYTVCLHLLTSNSCPQCRRQPLEIIADPKTQRRITGATVYCPNYHFECNWVDGFG